MSDQRCGTCEFLKQAIPRCGNCQFRPPGPLPEWIDDADTYRSVDWGRNCKAWKEREQ